MAVKEYNSWVYTMLETPVKKRWEWVRIIFESLTSPWNKKANPLSREMVEFAKNLEQSKNFDIVGFSANVHYVKHDVGKGDQLSDLKSVFVHAWGSPKLLFQHKKLPILIIVGGDLRVHESVLDEIDKNDKRSIRGITG
jgi:hypothetical protein